MSEDTRGRSTDDQLGRQPEPQRVATSRVVALVENLLAAMWAAGDDAEAAYASALEELRAGPDEPVVAIARLEAACDRRSHPRRWALVYAATLLESDSALPFLRQVVLAPIPPEQSPRPHSYSSAKQETILRTTAVEGIGTLGLRGNKEAVESLLEFLAIDSISIRRASVQCLLSIDDGTRERIAEQLPGDLRYLLDVRATQVGDVPQIKDPTRHLREGRLPEKPAPPDPEATSRPNQERSPKAGE